MKKNIILMAVAAVVLTACKDDFLERYPEGGTIRQDQYEKLADQLEGSVRGLYSRLYTMGGSSHDEFGKRSIDLWGDILCCDIAVTNKTYGWLYTDEQMLTNGRTGTIWGHYYSQLHNINATILAFKNGTDFVSTLQANGYPSDPSCKYKYSDREKDLAVNYAQVLGLRGYIYAQLAKFYTPTLSSDAFKGYTIDTYECCPVYTEDNMNDPQPLSTSGVVYKQAFADLTYAIKLYEEFGKDYVRPNKLIMDHEVICGILAQAYLNESVYRAADNATQKEHLTLALKNAQKVIESGKYKLLTADNLLTTGFNNVDNEGWIWGERVTVETSGGLKSWFGQVDIHSYSYAWSGDTKVIDSELNRSMYDWDKRKQWFNDGSNNKTYILCPDGKFFSAQNPTSTKDADIDRDWLSDNVFMRIESMYLIASEASYRLGRYTPALAYLREITDRRVIADSIPGLGDTGTNIYVADIATWSDPTELQKAIIYNWRIEMWGEGYGLETFRRWEHKRNRGDNHDYANQNYEMDPAKSNFQFQVPTSESTYNPNVKTSTLP